MKVLVADDDPTSRRMLEVLVKKWGYEVVSAVQGEEAWQALRRDDPPRLAILDWMMPVRDGVDVCREVRKLTSRPYIYIILLTAKGQKTEVVEGLDAGADDYLTKPFNPAELHARLRAGNRIVDLQEQLLAAHDALQVQATHDSLTGLRNRAGILTFLERELARATRLRSTVAIALLDFDHFKSINDEHGHLAGDAVLREGARRLSSAIRPYDALGRYGGDEFLAVAPDCDLGGARSIAEKFRARMNQKPIETSEGVIPVTLSLGVAVSSEERPLDSTGLLRAADTALYRAKAAGRNCSEMATTEDALKDLEQPARANNGPSPAQGS